MTTSRRKSSNVSSMHLIYHILGEILANSILDYWTSACRPLRPTSANAIGASPSRVTSSTSSSSHFLHLLEQRNNNNLMIIKVHKRNLNIFVLFIVLGFHVKAYMIIALIFQQFVSTKVQPYKIQPRHPTLVCPWRSTHHLLILNSPKEYHPGKNVYRPKNVFGN